MTRIVNKACFQHDMAYGDFRNLTRKTNSDKILHDKAFKIVKNLKYVEYIVCIGVSPPPHTQKHHPTFWPSPP